MPVKTGWCNPELFLEHNGVSVFHTYKDDDIDQGPMDYWFTTDFYSDDEHFDIRDLYVPSRDLLRTTPAPYLTEMDPAYAKATQDERVEFLRLWQEWHAVGFGAARQKVLIEAIELGLITRPED